MEEAAVTSKQGSILLERTETNEDGMTHHSGHTALALGPDGALAMREDPFSSRLTSCKMLTTQDSKA